MKRLLILVLFLLLCACQPTPPHEAIVNRADGTLEHAVTAPQEDACRLETPTRWEETIEMKKLRIVIDADVVTSEADTYPIQTIRRHAFTGADVMTLLNACCEGPFELRENRYSMSEIEADVRIAMRGDPVDWDDETGDVTFEPLSEDSEELTALREKLAQCPAEDTYVPFDPDAAAYSAEPFVVRAADGTLLYVLLQKDCLSICTVRNGDLQDENTVWQGGMIGEPWHRTLDRVRISEDVALAQCESFLDRAGLKNQFGAGLSVKGRIVRAAAEAPYYEEPSEGYILYLARNGGSYIPFPQGGGRFQEDSQSALSKRADDSAYAEGWAADMMLLYVTENGIEAAAWYEPNEYVMEANGNVKLMPFSEIQSHIRDDLRFSYAWSDEDNRGIAELHVKKIVLSCAIARIPNNREEALLVPAWIVVYSDSRSEKVMGHDSLMLINAIDGSYMHVD